MECRQRRLAVRPKLKQIDIATVASVAETTITHFEQGRWWIRETDRIVAAYSELLGTTPEALWRAALRRDDP